MAHTECRRDQLKEFLRKTVDGYALRVGSPHFAKHLMAPAP